ncbi:hypothetical protein J1D01_17350 [Seonamhaeicola sp. NFXS20]|uniref:hypothetical protein n=1 Tax=Seonamhaeicola sp. NFXS20 TaxID=2816959 RepID=UPI003B8CC10D
MSKKELLVLLLIDRLPSMNSIYSLTSLYDRFDFPANIQEVLVNLKNVGLIEYSEIRPLTEMQVYKSTASGKKILKSDLNKKEMLDYINTLHNPGFLYELTEKIMNKN